MCLVGQDLRIPLRCTKCFIENVFMVCSWNPTGFDLDWEIVIKFIRKGLVPLEIPVNYWSRSFGEGKKVRPFLDPMLWIGALLKFRYGKLYHSESPQEE